MLVPTFEKISEGGSQGWNTESSRQAEGFLTTITKFEFLMAFTIARIGMSYTKGLTVSLQNGPEIYVMLTMRLKLLSKL